MKNILLVDSEKAYTRVGLLENGRLTEFYSECAGHRQLSGNIYKGRVTDVLDGLQSAFVDIGIERTGFWYIDEALDHKSVLGAENALPHDILAKKGDFVMVQVTKEGTEFKGPKLSSNISIPGHFVVYLYNLEFVGVSNKITEQEMRTHLTELLKELAPKGRGFIARTSCLTASDDEILAEAKFLISVGESIQRRWESEKGVAMIHNEGNILYRTIRDMLSDDTEAIVCNDEKMYHDLLQMLSTFSPYFKGRIEYYDGSMDIYDYYGASEDVYALHDTRVGLDCGGFLMIEHTEALTAIDVNTGKYVGKESREDTVFKTNLEAAREIARQLRLRNIGGIIVIDFIDMQEEEHRVQVVNALKTELFYDRVKTRVLDMSGLGLVEVTRKKIGRELMRESTDKCPHCGGAGFMLSPDAVSRFLKMALKQFFNTSDATTVYVRVNRQLAEYIISGKTFTKECRGLWEDKRIYLISDPNVSTNDYEIECEMPQGCLPVGAILLQ